MNEHNLHRHSYMMLSRLQQDCEFFLGYGQKNPKFLWGLNVADHIAEMRNLFESVPEKPEWLSLEDINNYEFEMSKGGV